MIFFCFMKAITAQQMWVVRAILVCVVKYPDLVSRDGKGGLLGRGTGCVIDLT